jgi:predicted metalloprotease with PDZ domain
MIAKIAAMAAVAALAVTPALAATSAVAQLSSVKGAVMVNSNGKTAPASASALKAGDRVIASNGTASVKFADGCVVSLKAGSMVTIAAKSPCAAGAGVVSTQSAQPSALLGLEGADLAYVAGAILLTGYLVSQSGGDTPPTSP